MIGFEKEQDEFDMFAKKFEEGVRQRVGKNVEVKVSKVGKNNGILLTGLNLLKKGDNVAPTFYLEDYYKEYSEGKPLAMCVDEMIDIYNRVGVPQNVSFDDFEKYENVKNRLAIRLINAKNNKEMLEDMPHKSFADLAVVCQILYEMPRGSMGAVLIHNNHIVMWGKSAEEVIFDACQNAVTANSMRICGIKDMLMNLMNSKGDIPKEDMEEELSQIDRYSDMVYVVSNKYQNYGAAVIAYPGVAEALSNVYEGDYYIIPCSVHEVIIMPADFDDVDSLNETINFVNNNHVEKEEVLSDHLYRYDSNLKSIIPIYSENTKACANG